MHFGLEISATDRTQGGLRSALSSVTGFARSAMGALRDFNLGVRPIVAGLDRIIERGSELEVVRKAFESLTGKRGAGADLLARRLVNASSGTLRLAEAMQIANRALSSGMKFEQLATAIEFIGKKSIATGKDAREALNTVITGLSRGSTLFLDDFGILVDGIDGVRARFDKMKGKGAFDALGPAAQKAETVSQAIAEMGQQMGRLGVSGRETVFLLAGMKNAVGDLVDRLVLSVAKSKALKEFLGNARDLLRGIGQHFDKGGTFGELLMPALNVAKAFFIDLGANIGHGIAGALLKGLSGIVGFLDQGIDWITGKFDAWIDTLEKRFKEVFKPIANVADQISGLLGGGGGGGGEGGGIAGAARRFLGGADGGGEGGPGAGRLGILASLLGTAVVRRLQAAGLAKGAATIAAAEGIPLGKAGARLAMANLAAKTAGQRATIRFGSRLFGKAIPGVSAALSAWDLYEFGSAWRGKSNAEDELGDAQELERIQKNRLQAQVARKRAGQAQANQPRLGVIFNPALWGIHAAVGAGVMGQVEKGPIVDPMAQFGRGRLGQFQQWLDEAAAGQFAQTGFGDTAKAAGDFYGRFSSKDTERDRAARRAAALKAARGAIGLTGFARRDILRDFSRAEHDMAVIQRGGGGARQAGLRSAAEEIEDLRRGGFAVTPSVRRRIIAQHLQQARNDRLKPLRERVDRDRELLDADDAARRVKGVAGAAKANAANRDAGGQNAERKRDNDDRLVTLLETLNAKVAELKTALVGEGGRIAAAK